MPGVCFGCAAVLRRLCESPEPEYDFLAVGFAGSEQRRREFGVVDGVGVVLAFDRHAVVVVVTAARLGFGASACEPVAGVDHHAGLRRKHRHAAARSLFAQTADLAQNVGLPAVDDERVVVSLEIADMVELRADAGAEGPELAEVLRSARCVEQFPGRNLLVVHFEHLRAVQAQLVVEDRPAAFAREVEIEAGDGEEAVDKFFAQKDIALVLLDVMMPKMDGWEVLKTIRKYSQVPVIMLTARSEERDELQGFSLGVDEYISKPFSPKILVARVEAILRRSNASGGDALSVGGILIDKAAHQVTIDGKEVELSFKEFELLSYFVENQGIALSREKILNNVWNYDYFGDARTIDTHVKKLRSKMGDKGDYIKTIWGMGYKFEVSGQ